VYYIRDILRLLIEGGAAAHKQKDIKKGLEKARKM